MKHIVTRCVAQFDAEAYFYRCGIPTTMGKYFCLPKVRKSFIQSLGVDVSQLAGDFVHPHLTVLPMGFSWAMYLAQRVDVHISLLATQLPSTPHFMSGGPFLLRIPR